MTRAPIVSPQVLCRVVVSEERQGARAVELEPAGRVGQLRRTHAREDEREKVHRPLARASRVVVVLTRETRADDDVRVLARGRLDERLNFARIVLAVRVEGDDVAGPRAQGRLETGRARGRSLAEVERMGRRVGPGGASDGGGVVTRASSTTRTWGNAARTPVTTPPMTGASLYAGITTHASVRCSISPVSHIGVSARL